MQERYLVAYAYGIKVALLRIRIDQDLSYFLTHEPEVVIRFSART
jgi:hypothetical protein